MKNRTFKQLRRKLHLTIFLIPSLFVLAISLITSVSTYYLFSDNFEMNFKTDDDLLLSDLNVQYSLLNAKALSMKRSSDFIAASINLDEPILSSKLQSLNNSDEEFLGTIYYVSGRTITSSSVSGPPSYENLIKLSDINIFLSDTNRESFLSIRTEDISNSFESYHCDKSLGIMSIFSKAEDSNGNYLGLIEVDLASEKFYSSYLDISDHTYMEDANIFLGSSSSLLKTATYLSYTDTRALEAPPTENISENEGYYYLKRYINSTEMNNIFLYIEVPSSNLTNLFASIYFSIAVADLIVFFTSFFIGENYANKTVTRLQSLNESMSKDIDKFPNSKLES